MNNTAVILDSNSDAGQRHLIGLDTRGGAMITPEGLAGLILENEKLRHPDYVEGDVTLSVSISDLAKMVQSVKVVRVDLNFKPTLYEM